MTINLTDPANHPANGLLAVERIIRVREELQRTMFYANGGVMDYIVADAIKGLEELLMSRGLSSKPYGYVHKAIYEQSGSCGLSNDHETYADSDTHIALYTAPPSPQSSKISGIMPDYEGVAMTQRECYMAGKEAGLAEARKSPVIPDCWIPVSERMPPEGEALLVCSGGGVVQRTVYGFDGENWLDWYEQYEPVKAEQDDLWQPLPAAPKEVKSER